MANAKRTKYLVTGAAGFIGFHTVRRLIQSDPEAEIIGLDNINDYYDTGLKHGRLQQCGIGCEAPYGEVVYGSLCDRYGFVRMDIADSQSLDALFAEHGFEFVINLAAQAGVRYSLENPKAYVNSNLVGFANVLECCRHHGVKHLVYASSSSVYGINNSIPYSEEDNVDYPVSFYAATKKSNELMAHSYSHLYKLPTTGLRFFTVYGPWGRPDMSPIIFAKAIAAGHPIKVFNNGDMLRDFTYIDDIVEGVVRVASNIPAGDSEHPYYRIFNIGNSCGVNIMDFIAAIERTMGLKAKLEFMEMQPGDVKETFADTAKLRELIDYAPCTGIETGIVRFIEWFDSYYRDH